MVMHAACGRIVRYGWLAWLLAAAGFAQASTFPDDWSPAGSLVAPSLPADLPVGSAGCIVVGQHVDGGGATSKPRVMQRAFTKNVPADARKMFTSQVLDASARWRFRNVGTGRTPTWGFHRVVMGFVSPASGVPIALFDADNQDPRVAVECRLQPLADWTRRQAVPAAVAQARANDPLLVAQEPGSQAYWMLDGEMQYPRFPAKFGTGNVDACVIVGYVIGADGVPSGLRIMAINNFASRSIRALFEDAALAAVSTWRYAPGPDNLKRLPEFHQEPITFSTTSSSRRRDCKVVDLSTES